MLLAGQRTRAPQPGGTPPDPSPRGRDPPHRPAAPARGGACPARRRQLVRGQGLPGVQDPERNRLPAAQAQENLYNVSRTADVLGMQRSNLYKKITKYGLRTQPGEEPGRN
ncbi:MAG: hypothetical protein IPP62_01150 [bacterium]|nr:hypothetical protein [bacterium]